MEQFTEDLTDRWIHSLAQEFDDVTEGKWSVEEHIAYPTVKGNKGLVAKTKAAYHAISTSFSDPIDPTKPLIIQFEVKFQRDGDCGRGFIKLLEDGSQTNDIDVDGEIPWVVSFGPEFRCPGSVVCSGMLSPGLTDFAVLILWFSRFIISVVARTTRLTVTR